MGGPIVILPQLLLRDHCFCQSHAHTYKRAASPVETTMDLFTIKAVFSTPCDVLVWPGGPGGRSQKAEEGGFTIHLIGSGRSPVGWGTGGHCKGRS